MTGVLEAVVMGASAGALEALSLVLPALPASFRLPIFVVVHVPPDKRSILVEIFRQKCSLNVKEADDKENIVGGTVYFAPPDYHLLVEKDKTLSLSSDEPVLFSRPSIDVLFESAADAYGSGLLAVILTGANQDGASGIKAATDAGGMAFVQRPDEAFSPAMPEAALAASPFARALTLDEIVACMRDA